MHTFTTKPAIHSTCCPNQDTATHRVSAWTRPKLPAVPTCARLSALTKDTCQRIHANSGSHSYPPHCTVLPWICGTQHLSPYPTYATAHTMAQHLDLALARQMQTHHERGPNPHKKLTLSAKTGLWRATGGLHSEDSTKTTSGHFHMLHQKHHLACPAVHTNLCNKSTPMHNKHGQPKHPVSMHCNITCRVCCTCASCTPEQTAAECPITYAQPATPLLRSPGVYSYTSFISNTSEPLTAIL